MNILKILILVGSLLFSLPIFAQQFTPEKDGIQAYCTQYTMVADAIEKVYFNNGYTELDVRQEFASILRSMGEGKLVIKAKDIGEIIDIVYNADWYDIDSIKEYCIEKYKSMI